MPRIYLAGPDVFRMDALEHFALLTAICERFGAVALSPFDATVTADTSPHVIYANNMALIRSADGVVANLSAFRGAEPDSGTVFEVGAAIALGLPVVAYGVDGQYVDQVRKRGPVERVDGVLRDAEGLTVEDFGLPLNLMLSNAVKFAGTAEEAISTLAAQLAGRKSDA